jgi:hypothetical protein
MQSLKFNNSDSCLEIHQESAEKNWGSGFRIKQNQILRNTIFQDIYDFFALRICGQKEKTQTSLYQKAEKERIKSYFLEKSTELGTFYSDKDIPQYHYNFDFHKIKASWKKVEELKELKPVLQEILREYVLAFTKLSSDQKPNTIQPSEYYELEAYKKLAQSMQKKVRNRMTAIVSGSSNELKKLHQIYTATPNTQKEELINDLVKNINLQKFEEVLIKQDKKII